jgi:Tfp pilus assembly protein PilF
MSLLRRPNFTSGGKGRFVGGSSTSSTPIIKPLPRLALEYLKTDQTQEALNTLQRAQALEPANPLGWTTSA